MGWVGCALAAAERCSTASKNNRKVASPAFRVPRMERPKPLKIRLCATSVRPGSMASGTGRPSKETAASDIWPPKSSNTHPSPARSRPSAVNLLFAITMGSRRTRSFLHIIPGDVVELLDEHILDELQL